MKINIRKMSLIIQFIIVCYFYAFPQAAAEKSINVIHRIIDKDSIADQIHFSIISGTAITFDWLGKADHINYSIDSSNLDFSILGSHPEFLPVTSPWVSDPGPYWEAKLTGLKRNTIYYYKIGDRRINKFRTPPLPGEADFRICSTSDMHESSPECVAMFNQIAGFNPDIVITTGDLTGAGPSGQQEVDNRFREAMVWSQSAAWMPVWGNHDWEYTNFDDLRTYKGRFDIPNPGTISSSPSVSCCGEDWGWFDYGNTRFISLPEPWNSSTRKEWKKQVLPIFTAAQNDTNISFIVTFGHRSAYTTTKERSPGELDLRSILNGLRTVFPKYKLDLSGHNHQYERYQPSNGMTYIINSTAGAYYHNGWVSPDKPSDCIYRVIHYGILVLDFSKTAIKGSFVCSVNATRNGINYIPSEEDACDKPGSVIDSFIILKSQRVTKVGENIN